MNYSYQQNKEIYLWYFYVDKLLPKYNMFYDILSPIEKARAANFVFNKDKELFVISHGVLKKLLLRSLPKKYVIEYKFNKFGKPFLPNNLTSFNISHSNNVGTCILSHNIKLGVDVEYLRKIDWQGIVTNTLSKGEIYYLYRSKEESKQLSMFISMWTQKESVAKAIGQGLSIQFSNITASPDLGSHVSFYKNNITNELRKWTVYKFLLDKSYYISAAYDCHDANLKINEFTNYEH